ncbi:MAG TPA: CoA-binding protein [Candidatus Acidoferrales bacterium]|nr:CoA-binding protein [Candidatus Acidoferrales bacterium]
MPAYARSLDAIEDFLGHKRFAMVGISRDPKDFSVSLFEELCRRGYDVVPVNPKTPNVLGKSCYARVQDIQPPVEAALLMTSPAHTETVVADCAAAGIRKIWMYRAAGSGAVSEKAVEFCREHGMEVIPGECPFMFLPQAGGVHRLHAFLRKITGRFPKRTAG